MQRKQVDLCTCICCDLQLDLVRANSIGSFAKSTHHVPFHHEAVTLAVHAAPGDPGVCLEGLDLKVLSSWHNAVAHLHAAAMTA